MTAAFSDIKTTPYAYNDTPMHPDVRKVWEHFAELDKPADLTSGPFPLMCRQALALDDALRQAIRDRDEAIRLKDEVAPIEYLESFLGCPLSVWGGISLIDMLHQRPDSIEYARATLRRMSHGNQLTDEIERLREENAQLRKEKTHDDPVQK